MMNMLDAELVGRLVSFVLAATDSELFHLKGVLFPQRMLHNLLFPFQFASLHKSTTEECFAK